MPNQPTYLGWWTELGFGCEENPEEAAEILRLSAERGSADGMVAYADALLMSDPPDWKTAEKWISRAVKLGNESAKDLLPAVEWAKAAKSEQ